MIIPIVEGDDPINTAAIRSAKSIELIIKPAMRDGDTAFSPCDTTMLADNTTMLANSETMFIESKTNTLD